MRIRWTRRALLRLDEVIAYIANYDPAAAERSGDDIAASIARLGDMPFVGRSGRIVGTRELIVSGTRHIVAYRVEGSEVQILTVLHQAQAWPSTL